MSTTLLLTIALALVDPAPPEPVSYARDVRPILANHCLKCHGPDEAARKARLRLDDPGSAVAGLGTRGPVIIPGEPGRSPLIQRLRDAGEDRMPPPDEGDALDEAEIGILTRWIEAGAAYETHWSFRPIDAVHPPAVAVDADVRNPIDRFVLARLGSAGLAPSPAVGLAVLARCASLDLTGLPPSPEDVLALLDDPRPDAYERYVDRLLASPHFGERLASWWLDMARYADTKGYEADRRRTMWPYRDWVIRAFNADLPFDRFTIEQLAGDLLPDPTIEQRVATGFNRNTMTNDEGGTDDEEFRCAAVVDRVNTTMQVWMGLTAGCAQCHSHKYDPISHEEYYRLYAFFNQSADADAGDDGPLLAVPTPTQAARMAAIAAELAEVERVIAAAIDGYAYEDPGPPVVARPLDEPVDVVWVDDDLPAGARPVAQGGEPAWTWTGPGDPAPSTGRRASRRTAAHGVAQHYFTDATVPLEIGADDVLFVDVHLDPSNPPREIVIQLYDEHRSWEHRAYWGENLIAWGADDTPSRRRRGDLPTAGEWVRLEVPARDVGLAPGAMVGGWAFSQHGGTVHWDRAGVRTHTPPDDTYRRSLAAWTVRARKRPGSDLPAEIAAILSRETPSETDVRALRGYYLREVHDGARTIIAEPLAARDRLLAERVALERDRPRMPVMVERPGADRRRTHILVGGNFLNPAAEVTAGVPAVFPPLADDAPRDRLGLARWLVDRRNPLTARVTVNRIWAIFFGTGLVETMGDFGTQGSAPSHPALLDWLAGRVMDDGWSIKSLCRLIATSATYRQASTIRAEAAEVDRYNRLLWRGPRHRLDAEILRDQALAVSGLLGDRLYGEPVFPPQPDGIWQVVYSDDRWRNDEGEDRHRRGLYTFWRRTSPYPSAIIFDAPSREVCVTRRIRTNTPLQALVTLNDVVFVEAARAFAARLLAVPGTDADRLELAMRRCLARGPGVDEIRVLSTLLETERAHFARHPDDVRRLCGPSAADASPELAAWTVACNVILNLDEFLTKG